MSTSIVPHGAQGQQQRQNQHEHPQLPSSPPSAQPKSTKYCYDPAVMHATIPGISINTKCCLMAAKPKSGALDVDVEEKAPEPEQEPVVHQSDKAPHSAKSACWTNYPYDPQCPRLLVVSSAFTVLPLKRGTMSQQRRIQWIEDYETEFIPATCGIFIGNNQSGFNNWMPALALLGDLAGVVFRISEKYRTAAKKRTPFQEVYVKDEADQAKVIAWDGRLRIVADGTAGRISKWAPDPGIAFLVRNKTTPTAEVAALPAYFSALQQSAPTRLPNREMTIKKLLRKNSASNWKIQE